ncbi:MAG: hypothetical protein ACK56F_16800, partial [bacterium]
QLVVRASLNDKSVAILTQTEELAVVGPRGSREGSRVDIDALLSIDLSSGSRIVGGKEATVEQRVVLIAIDDRRRIVWPGLTLGPRNILVRGLPFAQRDVPCRAGADRV